VVRLLDISRSIPATSKRSRLPHSARSCCRACTSAYPTNNGALPPVVQRPGKGSYTGGKVAKEGLFHRWYSGQGGALPPVVQWPGKGSSNGGTEARKGLFQRWYRGQQRGSSTGGTEARKGFFHRWYSGQEKALPSLVQRPGKGSSTSGSGQEGALPSVVQRPGKGSTTGGTVGTEGLFHQWYRGQERALPPVVQLPGRGSSTSGTVARKGLFHRWYSRQTLKLPMSHCTPSLPRRIQAKSYPTSLTFILISSSHLRLGLQSGLLPFWLSK